MKKRPDMKVVGAKIYQLRQEKGLCAAAFARDIAQPVWLVMLLESAHVEQFRQLIDLLPDSTIEKALQEIQAVYGVSNRWLTTRYQSPKHAPLKELPPVPMLQLPLTMSSADVMVLLDQLMALSMPGYASELESSTVLQEMTAGLITMFELQQAVLRKDGHGDQAHEERQWLYRELEQRIEEYDRRTEAGRGLSRVG